MICIFQASQQKKKWYSLGVLFTIILFFKLLSLKKSLKKKEKWKSELVRKTTICTLCRPKNR